MGDGRQDAAVGSDDGADEILGDDEMLGVGEGAEDGDVLGLADGMPVGLALGLADGMPVGLALGLELGLSDPRGMGYQSASGLVFDIPLAKICHRVLSSPGPSRNLTITSLSL